jgi:hypothetical protein
MFLPFPSSICLRICHLFYSFNSQLFLTHIQLKKHHVYQGSKQRSYKIGGKTPGPELYDDGLTDLERRLVQEGKTAALAGAAKQRGIFVQGKGF